MKLINFERNSRGVVRRLVVVVRGALDVVGVVTKGLVVGLTVVVDHVVAAKVVIVAGVN